MKKQRNKYNSKYKTDEQRREAIRANARRRYYMMRYGRPTKDPEPELELNLVTKSLDGTVVKHYVPKTDKNGDPIYTGSGYSIVKKEHVQPRTFTSQEIRDLVHEIVLNILSELDYPLASANKC